jgi:hypothetical protein
VHEATWALPVKGIKKARDAVVDTRSAEKVEKRIRVLYRAPSSMGPLLARYPSAVSQLPQAQMRLTAHGTLVRKPIETLPLGSKEGATAVSPGHLTTPSTGALSLALALHRRAERVAHVQLENLRPLYPGV